MRMIFTQNFTDDTRRFLIGLVRAHASFLHGVQNTAMYRLQAVTDIRQSTRNDYAHRIVNIRVTHFLLEIYRNNLTFTKIHNLTSKSYLILSVVFPL